MKNKIIIGFVLTLLLLITSCDVFPESEQLFTGKAIKIDYYVNSKPGYLKIYFSNNEYCYIYKDQPDFIVLGKTYLIRCQNHFINSIEIIDNISKCNEELK